MKLLLRLSGCSERRSDQLRFSKEFPDWDILFPKRTITVDQLYVRDQLVRLEAVLESLKAGL
jgi:hypothetical protein